MVYLYTGFTMLPLHQNDGMEPKRRLAYATEIADFYRMQIVAKKVLSRGQKGEGRLGVRKQDIFWVALVSYQQKILIKSNWLPHTEGLSTLGHILVLIIQKCKIRVSSSYLWS